MSGSNTKTSKQRRKCLPSYNSKSGRKNRCKQRPYKVQAFMSGEEIDILEAKWKKFGFANRSDYIRFVLVHGVIDEVNVQFHVNASEALRAMKAKDKIGGVEK